MTQGQLRVIGLFHLIILGRTLDFLMGDGGSQEPGLSRLVDGLPFRGLKSLAARSGRLFGFALVEYTKENKKIYLHQCYPRNKGTQHLLPLFLLVRPRSYFGNTL